MLGRANDKRLSPLQVKLLYALKTLSWEAFIATMSWAVPGEFASGYLDANSAARLLQDLQELLKLPAIPSQEDGRAWFKNIIEQNIHWLQHHRTMQTAVGPYIKWIPWVGTTFQRIFKSDAKSGRTDQRRPSVAVVPGQLRAPHPDLFKERTEVTFSWLPMYKGNAAWGSPGYEGHWYFTAYWIDGKFVPSAEDQATLSRLADVQQTVAKFREALPGIIDWLEATRPNNVMRLTPNQAIHRARRWHAELERTAAPTSTEFAGSPVAESGTRKSVTIAPEWELHELDPLGCSNEGMALGHCVGTYVPEVASGRTLIYSLRHNGKSVLTFDVERAGWRIQQSKGYKNRAVGLTRDQTTRYFKATGAALWKRLQKGGPEALGINVEEVRMYQAAVAAIHELHPEALDLPRADNYAARVLIAFLAGEAGPPER